MNTNKDVWIGIIALAIITGLGMLWFFESYQVSRESIVATDANTTSVATTSAATTTSTMQTPQAANRSSQDVVSIALHITGASTFASYMTSSGVAARLTGAGPYTIFVPSNSAFGQLPSGSISKLSAVALKRFVEYHIVVGRAVDPSAEISGTIQALSGDMINFSLGNGNNPMINSAVIISTYQARNGVVYLIDSVLIPPTATQRL